MTQNFYFDIQRFATGTAVKIGGVVNNVEVGDTFTVEGAKYTVLAVEKNSVTALVDGTPAENLGKQIVIGDGKSIDGVTYQTTALEDADSDIAAKYTYKLDIGGNAVFVMVFDNAIESVEDSGGNVLSASGDDYTVNGKNFSLSLVDGIPIADYTVTNSVATTLDKVTYSFSVDSKPVEVVVKNDAISSVTVDSKQVGTKAGTYSVGEKSLKVSYSGGNLTAETAAPVSTSIISSVATYQVGDTKVTVTDGKLSTSTAKVNGHNAKLTYSADTKKITATYSVTTTSTTTTGDPNLYHVTLPDNSTVDVTIANGTISAVTYNGTTITEKDGTYSVTNGTTKYNLTLDYADNKLTATATTTTTISDYESTQVYTVTVGSGDSAPSTKITVKDNKLYQDASTDALTATNDGVYSVTVGSGENAPTVQLTYDDTDGIKQYQNIVDLSKLETDYEAKDCDVLTGNLINNVTISIADGATVTLKDVTIDHSSHSDKAGIECAGTATIILEGTNMVKGTFKKAGIQAGGENTTLTINGTGSLIATGNAGALGHNDGEGDGGAGIGSSSGGTCGNIEIKGGTITASSGNAGAGIGSGYIYWDSSACGNITISGGTVTASSGLHGAGIGSGYGCRGTSRCGNIIISGGTVTATGGSGGAGIGSGACHSSGNSICGNITISGGTVTATGGEGGAGIGSGLAKSTCGDITINGGTVTATGGKSGAGIGTDTGTCGNITIESTVTSVTATKGSGATNSIGQGGSTSTVGTVTIGGTTYKVGNDDDAITAETYTYPSTDISFTQNFTVNDTEITFTTTTQDKTTTTTTYKIDDDDEETTIPDTNKITVDSTEVTVTTESNKVKNLSYTETNINTANDQRTVTTSSTRTFTPTFDATQTLYTFAVNGENVSVAVDSSGNMTYDGKTVTDNKITVDGVEVTLNVSGKEITGASYLGEYSEVTVTDIEQVDVYKATIDGQEVSLVFDANNQCTVEVNGKNYLLTKTANGATFTEEVEKTGVEDSRIYLLEVGGEKYWIGCTFDADGNLTAVTSDDKNLSIDGTTIKIGDYTVEVGGTKDALKTSATLTVYGEGVKDVEVNQLFVLSGVKSLDGITVENGIVTLTESNLNGEDVKLSGDGYTLALDKNYSPTETTGEHFEGNVYKSESYSDGYEISSDGKSISYIEEIPATDLFTLSGIKSTDGITVENGIVTLTAANLNGEDIEISVDGYTLQLAEGIAEPTFDEGGWTLSGTTATYKSENNTDGYTLSDDKKIVTYTAANDPEISLKVYGVKSLDGLSLDGTTVTVAASSLDKQTVTISDGYTLALAEGIAEPTFDEGGWTLSGTTATYTNASNTDGYEISDDAKSISYVAEVPATDLFVLSGVKTTDGITVKNKVVTLTAANLNNQDAKIEGDGYTLQLAEGIKAPTFDEGGWTLSGTTATYTNASNTDGYEISDDAKSISYVAEVPATDLFVLSGVKTTDGITVKNNIVTLTAANLNGQDVKISGDGYTLQLADGIKAPTFDEGGWTLSGTTATYTSESNTAGYTLAGDAKVVTYTPAHDADISLKVYGVKSLDGLSLSGTTVTVAASSLDKQTVTISKGYTLAIADDVEQPSTRGKYWTQLDEDTYLYTSSSTTAGYTLSNNKITYSDESVSGEQYTIKGAADTELISETDDTEDVAEDSLSHRKVVLIETDEHNPENNLDFYTENYAQVKIASGQDSLITYDGARSKVDMADADNVTVVSFDGQVQLDNYDVESGAVVLVQDINDIIDAIKTNKIKLVGNEIRINFSSRVAINNPNNDSTVVELVNYDGEKQLVGFTGKNGGTLDMSEFNENAVLKGNYSENSPETKYIGSTLKGGKNNDTLLAGSRDYVDGGEGQNEIYLTPYEMRYKKDGATVVSGGNSRNTVYNFHEGFGYDGDYVQVENLSDVNFNFENDGLSIASENARLKLKGIGVNSSSADAVSDFGTENPELILLTDGQTTLNTAIAKTDESILVTEKDGLKPNAFFGKRSGLNFSEYGGTVEVNLADGTGALGGRDAIFSGINKIQAGDGLSTLIGSDENNTLIAGNGYGSLAGGAGDDELFGRSGSADKAGRTEFLYFEGDGRDVIYDFEFLTAENKNSGTADKIGVDTLVTKISCSGNDVVLQMNYSDENLTIKNAAGKTFQINDLVLKVDKNIVYDGLANLYIADGGDLVSVDSSVESAEIWLDNSRKTAFVGEIKTLDASAVDGKTSLAGNAFDNTIIAGNGDSSLWGGDFGNDLLIGGGGKNTFFYNFGNGNDTIQNAKAGDVVDLTNITLAEISAANITDSGVELEFIDGGTLTVNGTDCEYRVAGTSYVVDNGKWKIK